MAAQFGIWNFEGNNLAPEVLARLNAALAPYAPDGDSAYTGPGVSLLYHCFCITSPRPVEDQPYLSLTGKAVMWDGRLDNREELRNVLNRSVSRKSGDAAIVAAAYERWGTGCFERLGGDWAISIWDPHERCLLLARDFLGTRQLYYQLSAEQVTWCTALDPMLLLSSTRIALNEEYMAGWLSFLPSAELTPYTGIFSVPPSSCIEVRPHTNNVRKYWDFDPGCQIRHRSDAGYEEQFRAVFSQSVQRRLTSAHVVLAELSGGMDSSAIVCTADLLAERGLADCRPPDTVSYFDDSEPNWNERPFFTVVEEHRQRRGFHIDFESPPDMTLEHEHARFKSIPDLSFARPELQCFSDYLTMHGYRVVLSGLGGDEVNGGVPTPISELADLLAKGQIRRLRCQLKTWALQKRKPWFLLLSDVLREFLPSAVAGARESQHTISWLTPGFRSRQSNALNGYPRRTELFGASPSFQANLNTLELLRRQIGCLALPSNPAFERRFPFLDRNLLEFLFAIPREQLVRPGERRSLMRRAMRGILPEEILNRTRKASISRAPAVAIVNQSDALIEMTHDMVAAALGIVDPQIFRQVLQSVRVGQEIPLIAIARTLLLEHWLRALRAADFNVSLAFTTSSLPGAQCPAA